MAEKEKLKSAGCMWINKRDGKITHINMKVDENSLVAFANDNKMSDNDPDFNIYHSRPKE